MPSNDSSSDLDSRISAIVERTVGRMRDELVHRMQDTESRLRDITGRMGGESASAAEPVAELPAAELATPAGDATADLFDAVVAMDRGSTQQEVLAALLEGVGRHAGRSALFLTRADGAQGWGSYGFEETAGDMQTIVLSYSEGPLATLAEGRGCVPLTGDECGDFCRRMGALPAAEGLLVPFILRDRLAAALYVDRFATDPPLGRRSLQLLAYVGAQTVEGLAVRQRDETPTLQVATEEAAAPGVALWEAPPAAQPEPAPEPQPAEPQIQIDEPIAAIPPMIEPADIEPPVPESPVPESIVPEPTVTEAAMVEPHLTDPQLTEPQLTEPQLTEGEETIEAPPAEMTIEELAEEAPPSMVSETLPDLGTGMETAADDEWEVPAVPMDEPPAEPEFPSMPVIEQPTRPLDSLVEPVIDAPAEEPPPWAATSGDGLSTVAGAATPEPAAMTPPVAGPPASAAGESTEVRPPTDVSGPGWAFTASRAAAESGDDAQHEEARRLARLLVTEIKLYNEEQVEEGRRGNDIYARLREDIDRSRQIFNERVDDAVRQETDYFHEEMVRILAGGNAEALGV